MQHRGVRPGQLKFVRESDVSRAPERILPSEFHLVFGARRTCSYVVPCQNRERELLRQEYDALQTTACNAHLPIPDGDVNPYQCTSTGTEVLPLAESYTFSDRARISPANRN